jgi:hypothetical protein
MRRVVQAGLDLHSRTREWMKAGVVARDRVGETTTPAGEYNPDAKAPG